MFFFILFFLHPVSLLIRVSCPGLRSSSHRLGPPMDQPGALGWNPQGSLGTAITGLNPETFTTVRSPNCNPKEGEGAVAPIPSHTTGADISFRVPCGRGTPTFAYSS